jgi:uncharacterized protein YyaL (SSP411 family)
MYISLESFILETMTDKSLNNQPSNALINETSPYLLQHAHNPVNWRAWNNETLALAKSEHKPILVSIGYSACHWCHVMEHESFEDPEVAKLMNDFFVCIKVDREERPDVDQLYMSAAQLITGGGGWPLNCFAFPDGRPFYAGTYYQKDKWAKLLQTIGKEWVDNNAKLEEYASKLLVGIKQSSTIDKVSGFLSDSNNILDLLDQSILKWSDSFDYEYGGTNRAPKFPLPNNYQFLLRWSNMTKNQPVKEHVHFTLKKMARGGIYDQIGGGFARYSVDNLWKVPHFEKMLYDNAQLMSVYAEAYRDTKDNEYFRLIEQTAHFLTDELKHESGLFYSAYDADSEGVEGKYYVWTVDEINELIPDDTDLALAYFGFNERGYWEHNHFILYRTSDEEILNQFKLTPEALRERIVSITETLLNRRTGRVKPGLDDKCLTSWNGLAVSGFCEAFLSTGSESYRKQAIETIEAILNHQQNSDKALFHSFKNGVSTITGFLEDYAFTIQGLIDVYRITYDTTYLNEAKDLMEYALNHFYNESSMMFYFTSHTSADLITKQTDYYDNVIPSSNSMMCRNLLALSHYFMNVKYRSMALEMIDIMAPRVVSYGSGFSNWMMAMMEGFGNTKDVVIVGAEAYDFAESISKDAPSYVHIAASKTSNEFPVFEGRGVTNATLIYVCQDQMCYEPVQSVAEALKLMA